MPFAYEGSRRTAEKQQISEVQVPPMCCVTTDSLRVIENRYPLDALWFTMLWEAYSDNEQLSVVDRWKGSSKLFGTRNLVCGCEVISPRGDRRRKTGSKNAVSPRYHVPHIVPGQS